MSGMLRSFWGWTSADTPHSREEAQAWAEERRERKAAAKAAKKATNASRSVAAAAAAAAAPPPQPPGPAPPLYEFTALTDVLAQAKKDLALIRTSRCQTLLPSGAVVTASPSQAIATGQVPQLVAGTPLQASNHANPATPETPRPDSIASQAPSFQSVTHPTSLAQQSPSIPEGSPYLAQPSPSLASQDAAFLDSIQRSPSMVQRSSLLASQVPNSPIEITRTLSLAQRSALRVSLGSPLPGDIARIAPQLPNVIQRRSSVPVESLLTEGSRRSVSLQYYAETEAEDQPQPQGQSLRQLQAVTEGQPRTQPRPSSIQYEGPGLLGSTRPRPFPIQYEGPGPLGSAAAASLISPDGTGINTSPYPVQTAEQLAIEADIAERLNAIAGILGNINSSQSQLRTGLGITAQAQGATEAPTAPTATATPRGQATTVDIQNLERRLDLFTGLYKEYLERVSDGEVYLVARRARATELTDGQGRIGATGSVPVMRVPDCGF